MESTCVLVTEKQERNTSSSCADSDGKERAVDVYACVTRTICSNCEIEEVRDISRNLACCECGGYLCNWCFPEHMHNCVRCDKLVCQACVYVGKGRTTRCRKCPDIVCYRLGESQECLAYSKMYFDTSIRKIVYNIDSQRMFPAHMRPFVQRPFGFVCGLQNENLSATTDVLVLVVSPHSTLIADDIEEVIACNNKVSMPRSPFEDLQGICNGKGIKYSDTQPTWYPLQVVFCIPGRAL